MALQAQQHVFRYQSFHINKSQPLGHGSYGAVYKAKCDQLPCAAKVLHPTILDTRDPGAGKITDRFQQECAFLESIRHPNIVQYLGMTRDPESRLPVLLMELLDESLTKMLEHSKQSLAYYVQVDICHDIALAVAYLHSNDIIHRDLSSNNVLMIAGRRAKVTDFGMSKLAGAAPSMTPLTMCPGTLAYMPPEALREPPRYTKKLDCFSEGVIMIQVITQLWPEPGPRTQIIQDSRYPMGVVEVPVSETVRRKNHIDLTDPNHALMHIAVNCLQFQDKYRPSSEELCQRLAGLKETREYRESTKAKDNQTIAQLQEKDRLLRQKTTENSSLIQQLQDKDKTIMDKDNQLHQQSRLLRTHQEGTAARERQLQQLKQKLEEQEEVTAEIQQTNYSLQKQVEQLQQQLSQQNLKPLQPLPRSRVKVREKQLQERQSPNQLPVQPSLQVDHKQQPHKVKKMTLNWRDGGKAPLLMSRGAAVLHGNVAYFTDIFRVCFYDSSRNIWTKLPNCPNMHCSLAIVNGLLTAIGGSTASGTDTNKLLSLQTQWKEIFPPMPTERYGTTAVILKETLIVAGGKIGFSSCINTVEVMDTETLVWSTVASLPFSDAEASVTICGDQLYMLGGDSFQIERHIVQTCSLKELLQSSSSSSSSSIWHRVANAPAYYSTCAAVNGELLAIGGADRGGLFEPTSAIHKYNPATNSWDLISNMPTARYLSFVVILPTNEMMVVGGQEGPSRSSDNVEIASFK